MDSEASFFKFPRTVHLEGSSVVDDDETVTWKSLLGSIKSLTDRGAEDLRIVVQEKIDGANVSVHFEEEMVPIIQKRSGIIGQEKHRQYHVFRDWVFENMELLWALLGRELVLFGEWLWAQHAVAYDALPSFFVAFDMLEKSSGDFLSLPRIVAALAAVPGATEAVPLVPVLLDVAPDRGLRDTVLAHLNKGSRFGSETAEGVYVRLEDSRRVVDRWKIRRPTFVAGRTDFSTRVINNSIRE